MEFAGLCAIEGLTISAATLRQAPPAIALELAGIGRDAVLAGLVVARSSRVAAMLPGGVLASAVEAVAWGRLGHSRKTKIVPKVPISVSLSQSQSQFLSPSSGGPASPSVCAGRHHDRPQCCLSRPVWPCIIHFYVIQFMHPHTQTFSHSRERVQIWNFSTLQFQPTRACPDLISDRTRAPKVKTDGPMHAAEFDDDLISPNARAAEATRA
ncbi:uncharacterized protein BDW70DRAFT_22997 [Aspergillus foveolatus]|uniref:uncharacterized protein n=1 Tax=Aspergillus foveolatus TaxID=210207 RepID=UPI003CCDC612